MKYRVSGLGFEALRQGRGDRSTEEYIGVKKKEATMYRVYGSCVLGLKLMEAFICGLGFRFETLSSRSTNRLLHSSSPHTADKTSSP